MGTLNIKMGYLLVQAINLLIIVGWPLLSLWGVMLLRRQKLDPLAQALRVIIVWAIPFFGTVSFWLIRPGEGATSNTAWGLDDRP